MPSILSKILMPEWNLSYNCYELGHTWTPICSEAALDVGLTVFTQALKLYGPLYMLQQAVSGRLTDPSAYLQSLRSIVRSSTFLGMNAFLVIFLFCASRAALGRFYYTLCAFLPSFGGSLLAILWERPSRRRALAFYVANIASETAYRILASRGYIRPVNHGHVIMAAMAIISLLLAHETAILKDPLIAFVFRLVIGHSSAPKLADDHNLVQADGNVEVVDNQIKITNDKPCYLPRHMQNWLQNKRQALKKSYPILAINHSNCNHQDWSCVENILYFGLGQSFVAGWTAAVAWRSIPRMLNLRLDVQPFEWSSVKVGVSLAVFSTVYRCIQCLARHGLQGEAYRRLVCVLAGGVAYGGASVVSPPSSSLSLYLTWKAIETYFELSTRRWLPSANRVLVPLLYSLATAQLFYAAVLEPSHIKPSYKRFLDRVTHHKLSHINRQVLEVFGTNSSKGYDLIEPQYLLQHTTKRFRESVLVWLI